MLAIRIQCHPAFASEQDASAPLVALARVLSTGTRLGLLWARCGNALLPFDAATIGRLLAEGRSLHGDDPQRATHVLSLCATPEGPGEVGVVLVSVRPAPGAGAAPGLVFSASLAADSFDTDVDSLRRLLAACVDAVSPDLAMIGPSASLRELGVGWVTFARRVRRELLPAGAVVIATKSGSLVIAHTEEPASESASARAAVLQVRDALSPDPPKSTAPAPTAPPPQDTPSTAAPVQPSYLAAPLPVRIVQRSALAGTALGSDPPSGPALPFAPAPPSAPAPRVKRARPPPQFTGTADGVDVPQSAALPFVPSDAPPSVPELTLEQYADLRAQLAVRGEQDAETWKQFGVTSRRVKEALQARFAARFRQDPAMQARFVDLVQKRSAELRAR